MRDGDHRGLLDARVVERRVLERYATDPLPTGLDDVFRPIDDLNAAVWEDARDVARGQPTVAHSGWLPVVAGCDAMSSRLKVADRVPVVRQNFCLVISEAQL